MDENKKKLLENHERRLQKLKEKKAIYGLETPPDILMEIEDIEKEVAELQGQLKALKADEIKEPLSSPDILKRIESLEAEVNELQKELETLKESEMQESPVPPSDHLRDTMTGSPNRQPDCDPPQPGPLPRIDLPSDIELSELEITLLQHVHRGYGEVLVENEFGGGYSGTRVLLVLPVNADGRRSARKVTKLGPASELRRERDNYNKYVGDDLPHCVAQVREYCELDGQAALNYIFVGGGALGQAVSLEEYYRTRPVEDVVQTLNGLLGQELGTVWYGQSGPLSRRFNTEHGRHLVEYETLKEIVELVFSNRLSVNEELLQLPDVPGTYPNPLKEYSQLLNKTLEGRQSYVHGDLHLRNVLVDKSGVGRLIDFADVEKRHNLFDFIKLETYIRLWPLAKTTHPFSLRDYVQFEEALNDAILERTGMTCPDNDDLQFAYRVILSIRNIARRYMAPDSNFRKEYFPALFLYCLEVMKYYKNDGKRAVRLVFATACVLSMYIRREDKEGVAQVMVLLESNFETFTTTRQDDFIFALSRVLNIASEQIRILSIAPGSVIITLEMPEQAAQLFVSMWLTGDSLLRALGITKVELRTENDEFDLPPESTSPEHRQETMITPQEKTRLAWDIITIREKLKIFDDVELDDFCLTHFPDVFDKFGDGMRRDKKITLLLNYCRKTSERQQELLTALERENA